MKILRLLIIISSLFLFSCKHIAPTPILSRKSINLNEETLELVLACSEGPNYTPNAPGCDPELLLIKSEELMELAEQFIAADNIQSQSFDIYLQAVMVYYRITAADCVSMVLTPTVCGRQVLSYKKSERVARQFFYTELAYNSGGLHKSRFWWVYYTTSNSALQLRLLIFSPNLEQIQEIDRVIHEGENALPPRSNLSSEWLRKMEIDLADLKKIKTLLAPKNN